VGIEEIKTRKPVPGQNNKRNSFKKPTINDYYKKKAIRLFESLCQGSLLIYRAG
jgi:hypothetical protein